MEKIKNQIILIIFIIISFSPKAFSSMERDIEAPTLPEEKINFIPLEKSDEIIKSLQQIPPDQYPFRIKNIKKEFQNFLFSQKAFCDGNFKSIIFDPNNNKDLKIENYKKLSKEEKKICLQKLRQILQIFSDEVLKSQQKFMTFIHQKNLDSLQKTSDTIKDEFNTIIDK